MSDNTNKFQELLKQWSDLTSKSISNEIVLMLIKDHDSRITNSITKE